MDSIYVNAFHIAAGFYDMKIDFSRIEPVLDENGNVISSERIHQQRITIPVALAKELGQKLNEVVANYEETFGEIRDLSVSNEKQ